MSMNGGDRTQNAERRTQNAERRTQNAERRKRIAAPSFVVKGFFPRFSSVFRVLGSGFLILSSRQAPKALINANPLDKINIWA